MARSKETKIELTAYDDLFETDQSREEAKLSTTSETAISRGRKPTMEDIPMPMR